MGVNGGKSKIDIQSLIPIILIIAMMILYYKIAVILLE